MLGFVRACAALLAFGAIGWAGTAMAAYQIKLDSVSGHWTSIVLDDGSSINGAFDESIAWGWPATSKGRSSYEFDGVAPPTSGPFDAGEIFEIGTLTHDNFPISGAALASAELAVTIEGSLFNGDTHDFNITNTYRFEHFETPNYPGYWFWWKFVPMACAAGGERPCPDQVTAVSNPTLSQTFEVGDEAFTFALAGFKDEDGTFTEWLTLENRSNTAVLHGSISQVVPLPAALPLMLGGLGAVYGLARRRWAAAAG
jgi:hypothetical protein